MRIHSYGVRSRSVSSMLPAPLARISLLLFRPGYDRTSTESGRRCRETQGAVKASSRSRDLLPETDTQPILEDISGLACDNQSVQTDNTVVMFGHARTRAWWNGSVQIRSFISEQSSRRSHRASNTPLVERNELWSLGSCPWRARRVSRGAPITPHHPHRDYLNCFPASNLRKPLLYVKSWRHSSIATTPAKHLLENQPIGSAPLIRRRKFFVVSSLGRTMSLLHEIKS